jgi:hypothetical protein
MNDFPIPEDPPVMMTAEKSLRAAWGVDTVVLGLIYPRQEPALST